MSKRLSFALLLLTLGGCDTMTVIGGRDDASATDARTATDAGTSAEDAPRIAEDAPRAENDAFSTTDAFVPHGTGQFVSISIATTHPSISSTPMDRFDVTVRVQETEEGGSSVSRLIEHLGSCDVSGVTPSSGGPPALDTASVTAQIGSAAPVPLTFSASQGYTLSTTPPAVGTSVIVRINLGTHMIERTLIVRQMHMTVPTPIPAAIQWRANYTAGTDIPFGWIGGETGELKLVGVWDPLGINPSLERRDLTCTLDGASGSFALPWTLFNTHLVDATASTPMVWLTNSDSSRALDGDVMVQATSAALAEFTSISAM